MFLQPNQLIANGKYRVVDLLGSGASAEVYRVTHLALGTQRAAKVLKLGEHGVGSTQFTDFKQRFELEAQLGDTIRSPHLLEVYDYEDGDLLILIMEYAPGGSLAARLNQAKQANEPVPFDEAMGIALDVAEGLAAIHDNDVVHRDVKPSNILFGRDGHAKLADLGLMQVPHGPSLRSQLSQALPHPGTPAYMSPEQANERDYLTPASDVYALGLVLFEMLTGRVYRSQRRGTSVASLRPEVPAPLDNLIARMLDPNPEHRPFNGTELAEDLRATSITPRWYPRRIPLPEPPEPLPAVRPGPSVVASLAVPTTPPQPPAPPITPPLPSVEPEAGSEAGGPDELAPSPRQPEQPPEVIQTRAPAPRSSPAEEPVMGPLVPDVVASDPAPASPSSRAEERTVTPQPEARPQATPTATSGGPSGQETQPWRPAQQPSRRPLPALLVLLGAGGMLAVVAVGVLVWYSATVVGRAPAATPTLAPAAAPTPLAAKAVAPTAPPATMAPTAAPAKATDALKPATATTAGTAAAVATPAAPVGKTSQALEGPVWKFQSYANAQGQTTPAVANANVTAEFKNGRVNGSTGCNTHFASYKVDGNKLTISQAGSTMKACPDPAVMGQEELFLQSLSKAATYQISGDTLTVYDATGKAHMTFQATAAPSLTSNPWDVASYNNGKQAVVSVNPAAPMTAVFTADGKVSGSAGCNTYNGSYQVDGAKIKVGPLATTRKMCEPAIMEQETQFLKAFQQSATWSITNGVLDTRNAEDVQTVNFIANAAASAGLAGTNWKANGINNGQQAVVSLPTGVEVTAQFGTDGRVSGSGGCNTYSGPFTTDGANIKIGPVVSTMKACEGPAMTTEQLYFKALGAATKWAVEGTRLVLRDAAGAAQVIYGAVK